MEKDGQYPFFTCAKEVYRINTFAFSGEALLISGNGANVGYIHYYNGRFNAYQRTYVLEQFNQDIRCIQYLLVEHLSRRIAIEKNEGNTPYIVLSTLTDMLLRLPSIPEQRKIAALLSLIDERVEVQNAIIKEQEALKASLLRRLFDRTLHFPEFTDEWKVVKLGEICPSIQSGKDKKEEGEIPLYGAAKQLAYTRSASYSPPLILIGRVGSVGQLQWIDIPCGVSDNALVIQKGEAETVDIRFLFYCLKMAHLEQYAGGSSQKVITASFLKSLPLHLPPLPEQKKIAALLSAIDERIAVEKEYAALLQKQKAYLLRQMFV